MPETYLTVEQAAASLQVTERTMLQWLRTGTLPGRKLGGVWRIHPGVLDEFMRGGPVPAHDGPQEEPGRNDC